MNDATSVAPLDVVEATVGEEVTVRIKPGQAIQGTLEGYDHHLNVVLSRGDTQSGFTATDEQSPAIGDGIIVIRGQMVMSITHPPTDDPDGSEPTTTGAADAVETAEDDAVETDAESTEPLAAALTSLQERLTSHDLDVHPADDGQSLIVEKLGSTYHIRPDHVDGDGPHREQFEQFLND